MNYDPYFGDPVLTTAALLFKFLASLPKDLCLERGPIASRMEAMTAIGVQRGSASKVLRSHW